MQCAISIPVLRKSGAKLHPVLSGRFGLSDIEAPNQRRWLTNPAGEKKEKQSLKQPFIYGRIG